MCVCACAHVCLEGVGRVTPDVRKLIRSPLRLLAQVAGHDDSKNRKDISVVETYK